MSERGSISASTAYSTVNKIDLHQVYVDSCWHLCIVHTGVNISFFVEFWQSVKFDLPYDMQILDTNMHNKEHDLTLTCSICINNIKDIKFLLLWCRVINVWLSNCKILWCFFVTCWKSLTGSTGIAMAVTVPGNSSGTIWLFRHVSVGAGIAETRAVRTLYIRTCAVICSLISITVFKTIYHLSSINKQNL